MLFTFFNSLAIGYSGAIMPGSLLTYTIEKSTKQGKSAGFIISLGHAALEFFLVIFLFLGLGQFLTSKIATLSIGFIGGAILCYLGFSSLIESLKNKPKNKPENELQNKTENNNRIISQSSKTESNNIKSNKTENSFLINKEKMTLSITKKRSLFLGGILISATNPYFLVWWAAIGLKLLLDAHALLGIFGIFLFYIGHILADISWYSFVSFIIAKTSQFLKPSLYKKIIIILSFVLIFFGLSFIYKSFFLIFGT